jgi:hypothetical protein
MLQAQRSPFVGHPRARCFRQPSCTAIVSPLCPFSSTFTYVSLTYYSNQLKSPTENRGQWRIGGDLDL